MALLVLAASCATAALAGALPTAAPRPRASAGNGTILAVYMNCAQPGPTPGCQYHPYANTVAPANTTMQMNMSRQLQLSPGDAYGDKSAAAFDTGSGVLYFFQGAEATMYRVDAGAHKVLAPVKLTNVTKPSTPSSPAASNCTKRCSATKPSCDCHCYCAVCGGKCGDGCYDKCHGSGGCKAGCGDPDPEMVWYGVHAAYWDGTRGTVVAVARGEVAAGVVVSPGGLVSIDPSSGVVSPLDSGVDSGAAFVLGKGGGLSAFGAGLLVFPLVSAWDWVHSFQVVKTSTGVATRVRTTMDIVGLEYSDGNFWALGVALPGGSWAAEPGQPLIAKLNPNTGAFTMVANLTQLVGKGAPLREAWGIMTGEAGTWRAVTTFDHATGIMYFACDPNIVGVSVRTGEVTTSSPLVHWADGTQDAEFVSAMQFLH